MDIVQDTYEKHGKIWYGFRSQSDPKLGFIELLLIFHLIN
jgi:hypothetical protein